MKQYKNSNSSKYNHKKKHGMAFKVTITVLGCIVAAVIVLLAINFNTIMLMMGKGNVSINTISQVKNTIPNTNKFSSEADTSSTDDTQVLTTVSKDKAVTLTITQQQDGKETIDAIVDLKKIDTKGINKQALKQGNPAAIQSAKILADSYIGTVINSSDTSGIEAYVATNLISQYKSNPTNVNIDHTFGNAHLTLSGNLSTGSLHVTITK